MSVKNVKTTDTVSKEVSQQFSRLLPKSLPGSSTPSVSRPFDYVIVEKEEELLLKLKEIRAKDRTKDREENGGTALVAKGREVCVGPSQVHSILAGLALTPSSAETILRQELLKARSFGSGSSDSAIADFKHIYSMASQALSGTEYTASLCRVVGGTAANQRITNTIRLRRVHLRYSIDRNITATGTAAADTPIFTIVVWREKIPATVGTPAVIYGTDSNPPSSPTLMFSRLGSSAVNYNSLAVLNPVTSSDYHIYDVQHICLNDQSYSYVTPATGLGLPSPKRWIGDVKLDLNSVKQNYSTYTSTDADINAVWFTIQTDRAYTNYGYQDFFTYTTDCEFEDVQDGA